MARQVLPQSFHSQPETVLVHVVTDVEVPSAGVHDELGSRNSCRVQPPFQGRQRLVMAHLVLVTNMEPQRWQRSEWCEVSDAGVKPRDECGRGRELRSQCCQGQHGRAAVACAQEVQPAACHREGRQTLLVGDELTCECSSELDTGRIKKIGRTQVGWPQRYEHLPAPELRSQGAEEFGHMALLFSGDSEDRWEGRLTRSGCYEAEREALIGAALVELHRRIGA
mmetsp:Transcript_85074/g.197819  ORF Transcript_85074/g.197819 Transcript_85074/m.197819 type:complete len:224 (-) Transcript_85074:227-898(-)